MKSCPNDIVLYMHDFLDGELSYENEQKLKNHLQKCPSCQKHFHELKKTIALVQSTSQSIEAPVGFTENVMRKLPKEKREVGIKRWFRNHPLLVAASIFLIMMVGSVFSTWSKEDQFSFTKQPNLIVEDQTVIVPKGEVVKGDITVKNGNLRVEGKVEGDVTVINGEFINSDNYMASAGNVSGDIEEIDQIFDWIWYKMKDTWKQFVHLFEKQ